ncbi:hypothetical protein H0H87_000071 [Tephrocybe sp. NHM501043]|nr:hypothetical protein H0H87_000071 [Tephrocybe sp. NHM501043]
MTIELDTTLAQAEVLFLSFAQLVADIDRRKAEELPTPSTNGVRRRGSAPEGDKPTTAINLPILSELLRELLNTVKPPLDTNILTSLRTVLKGDKSHAKQVISALRQDAEVLRKEVESEMLKRYGFKWDIWAGFHAAPSMS